MGKAYIDKSKCIGCGLCVKDCFPKSIEMVDNKAEVVEIHAKCIECGHCIAVCPVNAVTIDDYDMTEVIPFKKEDFAIDPDNYLKHLKLRRTIRRFTDKQVPIEDINKILDAGRFSPTGGNLQNVAYTVVRDDLENVKQMVIDELNTMGLEARQQGITDNWYSELWIEMYNDYMSGGKDELFFNAGTIIAVSSSSPQAAIVAAAHMETMIYALGYGMLYSGFTTRAIVRSKKLQDYFINDEGYSVHTVLVIGEPDVKYLRSVPRKKANVIWK